MICLVIIIKGHGILYVTDNNETFSAINHAANLWNFELFKIIWFN